MKVFKFLTLFIIIAVSYSFAQFTNVAITTNTYDQSEPTIAVSPLNSDNVIAAWNEFRLGGFSKTGYAYSTNKGTTWIEKILVAPNGYTYGFDPSVSYDRYGNAFYCYIAYSIGPLGNVYVSRTTNLNNEDWNDQIVSVANHWNDKPFLAIDNTGGSKDGRIYVSWTDFSGVSSAIKFSYSTDHGSHFSEPITLATGPTNSLSYPYSIPRQINEDPQSFLDDYFFSATPAVGPNGDLYVVYMDINDGYNTSYYKLRKSTDGGITFATAFTAAQFTFQRRTIGRLDIFNLPSIVIDQITGNLYVTYMDQVSQTNQDMRVKFIRSTNGGNSWSTPTIIADFGMGWQFFPWISVDSNGRLSVFLLHSADLTLVDSYVTESYDNGVTFLSPWRVSTQSSNPANAIYSHHYQGVVNIGGVDSYCVWTDNRNGNADIYFSKVNTPPLTPVNFSGTFYTNHPKLIWSLNVESDIVSYEIWRKIIPFGGIGSYSLLTTVSNTTSSFIDYDILLGGTSEGKVFYKLRAKDYESNYSSYTSEIIYNYSGINKIFLNTDLEFFKLSENYPNPFNPSTTISFSIPEKSFVTLKVYDILGREIANLVNEELETGNFEKTFDASTLSSGVYIYRITAMKDGKILFNESKQMLMIK